MRSSHSAWNHSEWSLKDKMCQINRNSAFVTSAGERFNGHTIKSNCWTDCLFSGNLSVIFLQKCLFRFGFDIEVLLIIKPFLLIYFPELNEACRRAAIENVYFAHSAIEVNSVNVCNLDFHFKLKYSLIDIHEYATTNKQLLETIAHVWCMFCVFPFILHSL